MPDQVAGGRVAELAAEVVRSAQGVESEVRELVSERNRYRSRWNSLEAIEARLAELRRGPQVAAEAAGVVLFQLIGSSDAVALLLSLTAPVSPWW